MVNGDNHSTFAFLPFPSSFPFFYNHPQRTCVTNIYTKNATLLPTPLRKLSNIQQAKNVSLMVSKE